MTRKAPSSHDDESGEESTFEGRRPNRATQRLDFDALPPLRVNTPTTSFTPGAPKTSAPPVPPPRSGPGNPSFPQSSHDSGPQSVRTPPTSRAPFPTPTPHSHPHLLPQPPVTPYNQGPASVMRQPVHPHPHQHVTSPGLQPSAGFQLRAEAPTDLRSAGAHVVRSRAYSFLLDAHGAPIELGSGRFAKAYLGEERWLESKTDFRREVVIKILQKGVSEDDHMRFQLEKELLERVQGHPNIVHLFASGEAEDLSFIPPSLRDKVDPEFMILERLEMSLEERLKGSRNRGMKDDLLALNMHQRVFRTLDYIIPVASAIEYAHIVRNICHRDLKPGNILIKVPDPNLAGSSLEVRLADFNVAKLQDEDVRFGMTQMKGAVPGTLFFQSPEQETNEIELLVNVTQGVPEVEFFEDFYIQIAKNDTFSLFNRGDQYPILYADRARKRIVLARPYRDASEANVRARIQKSVGRAADIYSLGAMLYYIISGAYANPKTLYDAFHKFVEYERADANNTIEGYLRHEYDVINSLRAPKADGTEVAPADRFFTYKHYLDGNGELIDPNIMLVVAKCMIRNKPDSYCQAHELDTKGASDVVRDLISLYAIYGVHPAARSAHLVGRGSHRKGALKMGITRLSDKFRWMWLAFAALFRPRK